MSTTFVEPGETISSLADRIFDDPLRFPEIFDKNPGLDIFGDLVQGQSINIPEPSQILRYAEPVFGSVSQALGQGEQLVEKASALITEYGGKLPPELQGYAKEAIEAVGQVNGAIGKAQSILKEGQSSLRKYDGQAVRLVPWLLGGKR
jgi:hypothetical protein